MTASTRTTIATGTNRLGATIKLVHRTAGTECAGAGTRQAEAGWAYLYEARDGTRGGQWFATEAEARAMFDRFNVRLYTITLDATGEVIATIDQRHDGALDASHGGETVVAHSVTLALEWLAATGDTRPCTINGAR